MVHDAISIQPEDTARIHDLSQLLRGGSPTLVGTGGEHVTLPGSLYSLLKARYGIDLVRAQSWIEVGRCRPADAAQLGVRPGTPTLFVEGITYDTSERPVEFSRVMYRADRFRFGIESYRRDDQVLHLIGAPTNEEGKTR